LLRRAAAEHFAVIPNAPDNFRYARIKFNADNRCPFLSQDNLCIIHRQHGPEFLSKTCSRYPRALARFEGKIEKALYLSCPEAARLVLLSENLLPPQDTPRYSAFVLHPANVAILSGATVSRLVRHFTLDLLQDRAYAFWQRLFLLGIVCRRVHELINNQAETAEIAALLGQYAAMAVEGSLRPQLAGIPARPGLQLDLLLQLIQRRLRIEQPHQRFASCVGEFLQAIGYAPEKPLAEAAARYHNAARRYEIAAQAFPHFLENYAMNYVFRTRFPFADLPGHIERSCDPLTSFLLLALQYRFLHSLLIGAAAWYGEAFSPAHAIRVAHLFARAVEHNIPFFDELLTLARSPELHNMDAFAVLLRI
jgi:lysine-N-methylase